MANQTDAPAPSTPRKALKKGVVDAILATQKDVGVLVKSERNRFKDYDYVPIDTYYELVAPVAAKHGLSWKVNLILVKISSSGDDIIFNAVIDLIFRDGKGEEWEYKGYNEMPIIHHNIGAQTTGSASSYANKAFMRDVFKIASTGETDPDALPQPHRPRRFRPSKQIHGLDTKSGHQAQQGGQGRGEARGQDREPDWADDPNWRDDPGGDTDEPAPDYAAFERGMIAFANEAKTKTVLENGWKEKALQLAELEAKDNGRWQKVKQAFADRKAVLLREAAEKRDAAVEREAPQPMVAMPDDPRMRPRPDQIAAQQASGFQSRLKRSIRPASAVRGAR